MLYQLSNRGAPLFFLFVVVTKEVLVIVSYCVEVSGIVTTLFGGYCKVAPSNIIMVHCCDTDHLILKIKKTRYGV